MTHFETTFGEVCTIGFTADQVQEAVDNAVTELEARVEELSGEKTTFALRIEELEIEAEQKETNLLIALGNGVIE